MPVPKSKQKKYGILVATFQKQGMSLEAAKRKADKALNITHNKKTKTKKK